MSIEIALRLSSNRYYSHIKAQVFGFIVLQKIQRLNYPINQQNLF